MRFMRVSDKRIASPRGSAPPDSDVPAPRGTMGTAVSAA
jgi:hypothetical protein